MAFIKVGYLVAAVAAIAAAMPPESPAPAAIRNEDLLQEETQGFSQPQQFNDPYHADPQYNSQNSYPNQQDPNYKNTRHPQYSDINDSDFSRDPTVDQRQQFHDQQQGPSFSQRQDTSPQSEFISEINGGQTNYRDQSFQQEQDHQFQNQNYRQNSEQRFNEQLRQNPNQELSRNQRYNQRQNDDQHFLQGQRVEQIQQSSRSETRSSGSFQNQRIQNQSQFSGSAASGNNRVAGILGAVEDPARDNQRYDNSPVESADESMGNYQYSYDIHSEDTGDMKYHKESRDGNRVIGEYRVKEADGSMRIVKYTADAENGFQATVEYVMDDEEPIEFGAKMNPKTSRSKNQRNLGNRSVFESSRNRPGQSPSDRSRLRDRSQTAKEDMSLFFNSATIQGPARSRPGPVGDIRGFQQQSSRFDSSLQNTQEFQDTQGFPNNIPVNANQRVPSEFQVQDFTRGQFSEDPRGQLQTSAVSSLRDQGRRQSSFQNSGRPQFLERDQFQGQDRSRFQNENRAQRLNQERYDFQNEERRQFQNENRNQFQNENRNQFQRKTRNQFQNENRNQFQTQFQNQERNQFQVQNRNDFQNQDINEYQSNERDQFSSQERGSHFQMQEINQNLYDEISTFQSQRRNPFQSRIQNQEQNTSGNEERERNHQFLENSYLADQMLNNFRDNERNGYQDQYQPEDNNQFQQQRDQYEFEDNVQFSQEFGLQSNRQVNNQRINRPQADIREKSRLQVANQFQRPIQNQPADRFNKGIQDRVNNEFQEFNENQFSSQRGEPFPSQGLNTFQNQNRIPGQQFSRGQFVGYQQRLQDQSFGRLTGQKESNLQTKYQQQEQRGRFDSQQSQDQNDGQLYGARFQENQFQGVGVYDEMSDKRYQNQRYGEEALASQQGRPVYNQASESQREFLNTGINFDPQNDLSNARPGQFDIAQQDFQRQGDNFQPEEQFSGSPSGQARHSFQNEFDPEGLHVSQSNNNFKGELNRPVPTSTAQFQNNNFSVNSQGLTRQNSRYGVKGQRPQQQRFETIADPHPQAQNLELRN